MFPCLSRAPACAADLSTLVVHCTALGVRLIVLGVPRFLILVGVTRFLIDVGVPRFLIVVGVTRFLIVVDVDSFL